MDEKLYHHGDLKKEMIRKGIQLLNKEGYEGFSLRKLAAMCNVSHAAPYRHFRNKEELYRAINLEISTEFKNALLDDIDRYQNDPRTQLMELCKHYIAFMVKNHDYFRYIFQMSHDSQIKITAEDILIPGDDHPFNIGKTYAKEYFCRFHENETDWVLDFLSLWSQIHGLTLLLVNRTISFQGEYMEYVSRMLESALPKSNLQP